MAARAIHHRFIQEALIALDHPLNQSRETVQKVESYEFLNQRTEGQSFHSMEATSKLHLH